MLNNERSSPSSAVTFEPTVSIDRPTPLATAQSTIAATPPLWSLERFVAVNPLMAYGHQKVESLDQSLEAARNGRLLPELSHFHSAWQTGVLKADDLSYALAPRRQAGESTPTVEELIRALTVPAPETRPLPTATLPSQRCGRGADLAQFAGKWWASLLDESRATLSLDVGRGELFATWKELISRDRELDLAGLGGVRRALKATPSSPLAVIDQIAAAVRSSGGDLAQVFAQVAAVAHGWLSYARFLDREANTEGAPTSAALQVFAAFAALEGAVVSAGIGRFSSERPQRPARGVTAAPAAEAIWLEAAERAVRRRFLSELSRGGAPQTRADDVRFQLVFCIDPRSEPFRRRLESLSRDVTTVGFAGFFGIPVAYPTRFGTVTARCPVLAQPKFQEQVAQPEAAVQAAAWAGLKTFAATTFSYVEAAGLAHIPLLLSQAFPSKSRLARSRQRQGLDLARRGEPSPLPLADKLDIARAVLRHTGLAGRLARTVVLCGHGATTQNNPHASALDCGACGGHSGEVNAVIACDILNDTEVRAALAGTSAAIPAATRFVPGLHDTTTGIVSLGMPTTGDAELLALEGLLTRARAADGDAIRRAGDVGEVRPEWGLARQALFIAARRSWTRNLDLDGRAFLNDYDPSRDSDLAGLELILTAPLIVAHWINMQYYASTVDHAVFGSGHKPLHNVVGGFGVLEGRSYDLRVGLPWQSLHDGKAWYHEPLRLQAIIEADPKAIDLVLAKHDQLRNLVDHGWITVVSLDSATGTAQRRHEGGHWRPESADGINVT